MRFFQTVFFFFSGYGDRWWLIHPISPGCTTAHSWQVRQGSSRKAIRVIWLSSLGEMRGVMLQHRPDLSYMPQLHMVNNMLQASLLSGNTQSVCEILSLACNSISRRKKHFDCFCMRGGLFRWSSDAFSAKLLFSELVSGLVVKYYLVLGLKAESCGQEWKLIKLSHK